MSLLWLGLLPVIAFICAALVYFSDHILHYNYKWWSGPLHFSIALTVIIGGISSVLACIGMAMQGLVR